MSSSDDRNEEVESVLIDNIIPPKSREKYLKVYDSFMKWKAVNNINCFSEKVFLDYFNEISKTRKPTSLWMYYSMLKSTMRLKHHVYLQNYSNLLLWLRNRSVGHQIQSAKSKILTEEQIKKFLDEAPDEKYLATKVVLILGVSGELRPIEMTFFKTSDLKMINNTMIGVFHDSQNKTEKMFAIREDYIPVVKKYQAMRPKQVKTDRFFLNFREGRCTRQVIGQHKLARLPKEIANYLKLPTPERYTGHCFRRTGAAIGKAIKNINKSNEKSTISAQREFAEFAKFASSNRETGVTMEKSIYDNQFQANCSEFQEYDTELTHEINIKNEVMEDANEVYVKSEPVEIMVDPIKPYESDDCLPTTSKPSGSGKYSPSPDILLDDSDEDETLADMVRIRSEDMDHVTTLKSLRDQSSSQHDTKITVAGKNITILFKNCANVGNVTINVVNK